MWVKDTCYYVRGDALKWGKQVHTCILSSRAMFKQSMRQSLVSQTGVWLRIVCANEHHRKSFAWKSAPIRSELSKEVDHKIFVPLKELRSLILRPFKLIEIINLALAILYSSDNHPNGFFWTFDKKIHKSSRSIYTDLFPCMGDVFLQNHKFYLKHMNFHR